MIPLQVQQKKGHSLSAQLTQQIRHGILAGKLKEGERLPSVRELATQLKIHPLTIAKAYTSLENEGLVKTHWGKGTFVAAVGEKTGKEPKAYVKELVSKFLDETMPLVSGPNELKEIFEEQLNMKGSA